MNVVQVGEKTTGKYVGSITVKDYYTYSTLNTEHKYAMQPIVLKIANSAGISDFVGGLTPDVTAEEDIADLKPFGDLTEPLLAATIDYILGTKKSVSKSEFMENVHYELVMVPRMPFLLVRICISGILSLSLMSFILLVILGTGRSN